MPDLKIIYAKDVPQQDMRPIPWQIHMQGEESGFDNYYSVHWCMPVERRPEFDENGNPVKIPVHPPHKHKDNEIIMLIGGDPFNPYDLGATVEFCLGDDMKKYTFTESTTIMIPAGMPHGFYRIVECHKPFIFASCQETKVYTEKFLWHYLTQEQIDSIDNLDFWKDTGYEDGEE